MSAVADPMKGGFFFYAELEDELVLYSLFLMSFLET
jgi:hypothetical protein